jgi:hypothetical protein
VVLLFATVLELVLGKDGVLAMPKFAFSFQAFIDGGTLVSGARCLLGVPGILPEPIVVLEASLVFSIDVAVVSFAAVAVFALLDITGLIASNVLLLVEDIVVFVGDIPAAGVAADLVFAGDIPAADVLLLVEDIVVFAGDIPAADVLLLVEDIVVFVGDIPAADVLLLVEDIVVFVGDIPAADVAADFVVFAGDIPAIRGVAADFVAVLDELTVGIGFTAGLLSKVTPFNKKAICRLFASSKGREVGEVRALT